MEFMPQDIASELVSEQKADKSLIKYLDDKAERMLSDLNFWHRITSQGNPIINLKKEMELWIIQKKK